MCVCATGAAEQATPIHDTFGMEELDGGDATSAEISGVAVVWNEHSCFYLPATPGKHSLPNKELRVVCTLIETVRLSLA